MNEYNYLAFHLPAFEKVAAFLSPAERFNMALQTNEDVLNRLAVSRSKPRNVSFDVTMEMEQKTIALRFEDSTKDFKILFAVVLDPSVSFTVITPEEKSVEQLLRTLGNVRKIFSGSVSRMTFDLSVLDEKAVNELSTIECEKLTVMGRMKNFPKEKVAEALSNIKASQEYCIESVQMGKVFPIHPSHKIFIRIAPKVTGADLLKIAGQSAQIELGSTLNDEDVNKFIKLWMDSSERTTVSLKLLTLNPWDPQQILQGIENSNYQLGTRDRRFVTSRSETGIPETVEDMGDGRDILRSDGLRASVRITGTKLFFCVWHNPNEIQNKINEYRRKKRLAEERKREFHRRTLLLAQRFAEILQEAMRICFALRVAEDDDERMRLLQNQVNNPLELYRARYDEIRNIETGRVRATREVAEFQGVIDTLNRFL